MSTSLGLAFVFAGVVPLAGDGPPAKPAVEKLAIGFLGPEIVKLSNDSGCLLAADVDGDGKTDLVVANNQKLKIEFLLQARAAGTEPARASDGPNDPPDDARFSRKSLVSEKRISSLACGDWNGDTRIDLAYYGDPKELVVVFRDADGGYSLRREFRITDGSASTTALRSADLDADGKADLLLLGEECVYAFFQRSSGLAEPVKIPMIDKSVVSVLPTDVDGDGKLDLLMTSPSDARPIRVRFQESPGQFGPERRFKLPAIAAWDAADLDGDRRSELIVIEQASNRVRLLGLKPRPPNDGATPLGRLQLFPLSKGSKDRSLAIGELDGDGRPEIVVSDPAAAQLLVFRSEGGGVLSRMDAYPALTGIRTVRVGDVEGDGRDEVAVFSSEEKAIGISRLEPGGRLGFPKVVTLPGEPLCVELTDVTGDGLADLVYVTREHGANERGAKEAMPPSLVVLPGTRGGLGSPQSTPLPGVSNDPGDIRIADIDRDGRLDVLLFTPYQPMRVCLGGASGFTDVSSRESFKKSLVQNATAAAFGLGDLDADGRSEVLLASGKNFARSIAVDASGSLDVVDQFNAAGASSEIVGVVPADLGGGGSPQVVLLDKAQNALVVLRRGRSGVFEAAGLQDLGPMEFRGLAVRDLNGDGRSDVVVHADDRFGVLFAGGDDAEFEEISHYECTIKNAKYADLAVGDLTGNGKPDLALLDVFNHLVDVVTLGEHLEPRSELDFRVFEEKSFRGGQFRRTSEPREAVIADVTGDGRRDLILLVHDRVLLFPQEP